MTDLQPGLLLSGIALGVSIAAPLGPVNVAMIQRGLAQGFGGAFLLGVGSTAADLIYILLAYAGADPLAHLSWARLLLFLAGAAVMGWLGFGALQSALRPASDAAPAAPAAVNRGAFVSGFLITIVNPMTIAFWLGILSASLAARARAPLLVEGLYIASLALGCLLWCFGLAVALHYGRRVARGAGMKMISFAAGVALLGFGVRFLFKAIQEIT